MLKILFKRMKFEKQAAFKSVAIFIPVDVLTSQKCQQTGKECTFILCRQLQQTEFSNTTSVGNDTVTASA